MNRKENLLWTLYQDLYPKYQSGEVDIIYLLHVRDELFNPDSTGLEELEEEDYSDLDREFNLK